MENGWTEVIREKDEQLKDWKRAWRLMEAANKQAEERVATLEREKAETFFAAPMSESQHLIDRKQLLGQIAALRESRRGCICHGCGLEYREDVVLSDNLWNTIRPKGKEEGAGLLCGKCIGERLTAEHKRLKEGNEVLSDEIKGLHHLIDQTAIRKDTTMTNDRLIFLREIETLKRERDFYCHENGTMRELIDGCMDVVALWGESPYQKKWSKEWVEKARKVLG